MLISVLFNAVLAYFPLTSLAQNVGRSSTVDSSVRGSLHVDSIPLRATQKLSTVKANADKQLSSTFDRLSAIVVRGAFILESDNRYNPVISAPTGMSSPSVTKIRAFQSVISLSSALDIGGVPFNFTLSTAPGLGSGNYPLLSSLFKFDFNPSQMAVSLQSDLERYYAVQRNLFAGKGPQAFIRNQVTDAVRKRFDAYGIEADELNRILANPQVLKPILSMDQEGLRERVTALIRDSAITRKQRYLADSTLLPGLSAADRKLLVQHPGSAAAVVDMLENGITEKFGEEDFVDTLQQVFRPLGDSSAHGIAERLSAAVQQADPARLSALRQEASKRAGIAEQSDAVMHTVTELKAQFFAHGYDLDQFIQMENLLNPATGLISRSEITQRYLQRKPVNALQRFFSGLSGLRIGAFSNQLPVSMRQEDIFVRGTDVTLKSAKLPFTFGFGTVNDVGSVKDAGFAGSVYNQPRTIVYIGAQLQQANMNKIRIGLASSMQRQARSIDQYPMPVLSQNMVTFTAARDFNIRKAGQLTVDISRSGTLYANKYEAGSQAIFDRQNGYQVDPVSDLFTAMSVGMTHQLQLNKPKLSEQFFVSYAGQGYQNAGSNGFGGGRFRIGGNLRKSLLSDRLTLMLRTDFKSQPISFTSSDKWTSAMFQLDSRFRVNRRLSLNLRISSNETDKQVAGTAQPVYTLKKYQLDGTTRYKFGKINTIHSFSAGLQDYSRMSLSGAAGDMLMFHSAQTAMLGDKVLTLTMFYNRELAEQQMIGNFFNADLALNYAVFGRLRMTTAATMLDNGQIAQQAGIKQGIQFYSDQNFELDGYVDWRKNMIKPQYADLYAACRAEITLRYHFRYN